jgi:hypothetical protein
MEFTCEQIGLTQEELQERVIEGLVSRILGGARDEDGYVEAEALREAHKIIKETIEAEVQRIGQEELVPIVKDLVTSHTLQHTNQWGEAKGEALTFTEYLVQRANHYLKEEVNHDGKSKSEVRGSSWYGAKTTRIAHMIDKYLNYEISRAMVAAVESANVSIADGLADATKIALRQIADNLNVEVKTKK